MMVSGVSRKLSYFLCLSLVSLLLQSIQGPGLYESQKSESIKLHKLPSYPDLALNFVKYPHAQTEILNSTTGLVPRPDSELH